MSTRTRLVIDSHLHIWAKAQEAATSFPYAQDPPENLCDCADIASLLQTMRQANVDGALIVQPINYQYDHSYVRRAIQQYPAIFKGMMLYDPSTTDDAAKAISRLEELALAGFVGVRFNPYLWKKLGDQQWERMSEGASLEVYKRCGTLQMPVGIMCFQGLSLHFDDIVQLLTKAPDTIMILDHFAFSSIDHSGMNTSFDQLLSLATYPSVHVKISALFRLNDDTAPSYTKVYEQRFVPLLSAYGANRLLYGSDFPFVVEQPGGYQGTKDLISSWCPDEATKDAIMGGTTERIFGPWGTVSARLEEN